MTKKREIYFEILLDFIHEDKDEKKEKKSARVFVESRKYVYKIEKGKDNIHVLNQFWNILKKNTKKKPIYIRKHF